MIRIRLVYDRRWPDIDLVRIRRRRGRIGRVVGHGCFCNVIGTGTHWINPAVISRSGTTWAVRVVVVIWSMDLYAWWGRRSVLEVWLAVLFGRLLRTMPKL
jgi:hypothetical protein